MKKLEWILIVVMFLSLTGNLFRIDYSTEIFGISNFVLSCIYFYLGFAIFNEIPFKKLFKSESYKNLSIGRIIGSIGLGISLSIILVGFMFKFLFLPGTLEMLIIGIINLIIVGIIALGVFVFRYKGGDRFYKQILIRISIALIVGFASYQLNLEDLIDFKFRDNPKEAELRKEILKDPENEELHRKLEMELEQ